MDDDGTHGDDTTYGERTGVAHKHLCRIGIVPEEADERTHKGTHEDHQLLRIRDIHDVQV